VILIDTHVVLWLAGEPDRISRSARAAIALARESRDALAICDVSLLEITTLSTKGQIRIATSIESVLSEIEARFVVLPITSRACLVARTLPASYPQDPADRIIGATAIAEGLPLVTADRKIRKWKAVQTIW
jgi:PIN domain nuclease of toxin-antitoxin system